MKRIGEYVTGRVLAWIVIAALAALFGIGNSRASTGHQSLSEAQMHCEQQKAGPHHSSADLARGFRAGNGRCEYNSGWREDYGQMYCVTVAYRPDGSIYDYGFPCRTQATGESNWHEWVATNHCTPPNEWPDPANPGQCLDDQKCRQRNAGLGTNPPRASVQESVCIAGCQFKFVGPHIQTGINGRLMWSGTMEYSGAQCPNTQFPVVNEPPRKPQECVPAGAGQTVCVKPNGDQCHTASTGRQICWKPGETGNRNDGTTTQERNAGPEARPPNLQLPNGDNLIQSGPPVTTTTTTINNTTNNTTTTTTTTTTNYTTQYGTRPGGNSRDSGESDDGEDEEPTTPGEGGGEENGVTGGSCEQGYTTTGDPILGATLKEIHKQRCASEKEAENMRADANTLAAEAGDADGNAGDIFVEGEGGLPSAFSESRFTFGAAACPDFPDVNIGGVPLVRPAAFCDMVAALHLLFVAIAYVWGIAIVGRA